MIISSARLISLSALFLAACSPHNTPQTSKTSPAATRRPLFSGRSVATGTARQAILKDDDLNLSEFDNDLESEYNSIDPEKSVFVHNPASCCQDGFYSIVNWMNTALSVAHPKTTYDEWLPHFQQGFSAGNAPDLAHLQLWAVANRLDLNPPELHLVYGPANATDSVRAIIEFVLPSDAAETHAEAQQWAQLSNASATPNFAAGLLSLLKTLQPKIVSARIRTNSIVSAGTANWFMTQWNFGPNESGLQPGSLTDQIVYRPCLISPTAGTPADPCANLSAVWNHFPPDPIKPPLPDAYPFNYSQAYPKILSGAGYNPVGAAGSATLSIPNGLAHPTTAARDVLAMQQCFFCHGGETQTVFTHVLGHDGTLAHDVSCFLGGKNGVAKPTFAQLNDGDTSTTCAVSIQFMAPSGISCASDTVSPACAAGLLTETRNFQEIARRTSHLATLLLQNGNRLSADQFASFQAKSLANSGAHMAH